MRIDKYLKVSRLIKRRETAKDLCLDGDITINGKLAKPMSEVNPEDVLVLRLGKHEITARIKQIREFARKEQAVEMYEILSDKVIVSED